MQIKALIPLSIFSIAGAVGLWAGAGAVEGAHDAGTLAKATPRLRAEGIGGEGVSQFGAARKNFENITEAANYIAVLFSLNTSHKIAADAIAAACFDKESAEKIRALIELGCPPPVLIKRVFFVEDGRRTLLFEYAYEEFDSTHGIDSCVNALDKGQTLDVFSIGSRHFKVHTVAQSPQEPPKVGDYILEFEALDKGAWVTVELAYTPEKVFGIRGVGISKK